jgi:hypothetical protein
VAQDHGVDSAKVDAHQLDIVIQHVGRVGVVEQELFALAGFDFSLVLEPIRMHFSSLAVGIEGFTVIGQALIEFYSRNLIVRTT